MICFFRYIKLMVEWQCNGDIDKGGDVGVINIDDGRYVEDRGDIVTLEMQVPSTYMTEMAAKTQTKES